MRRYGLMAAALLLCGLLSAQVRNEIRVPDIPGYTTLKGDMHIHTVFSDGSVWPTTRVDECVMDGVDVLCMTDHVDSRLHKYIKDGTLNPDKVNRNTAYEMAAKYAKGKGVIVVRGGEISSQIMPPGHLNVLFTTDNEPIGAAMDAAGRDHQPAGADAALKVAKSQGAFVTWNHPHWCRQAPNVTRIYPEHLQYIKDGVINAIEAYNWWDGFSKEAFRWAQCLWKGRMADSAALRLRGSGEGQQEQDQTHRGIVQQQFHSGTAGQGARQRAMADCPSRSPASV